MQILQMPIQSPIFNVQAKFANSSPTSGCREQGMEDGVQLSTVGISSITMAYPRPGSRAQALPACSPVLGINPHYVPRRWNSPRRATTVPTS